MCVGTGWFFFVCFSLFFFFVFRFLHKQQVMLPAHSNKYTNTPKPISSVLLGWTLGSLTIAMLPLDY